MTEPNKPTYYPASLTSAIFFIPMMIGMAAGFVAGHLVSPFMSGFVVGRKHSKELWHFDDLEEGN